MHHISVCFHVCNTQRIPAWFLMESHGSRVPSVQRSAMSTMHLSTILVPLFGARSTLAGQKRVWGETRKDGEVKQGKKESRITVFRGGQEERRQKSRVAYVRQDVGSCLPAGGWYRGVLLRNVSSWCLRCLSIFIDIEKIKIAILAIILSHICSWDQFWYTFFVERVLFYYVYRFTWSTVAFVLFLSFYVLFLLFLISLMARNVVRVNLIICPFILLIYLKQCNFYFFFKCKLYILISSMMKNLSIYPFIILIFYYCSYLTQSV